MKLVLINNKDILLEDTYGPLLVEGSEILVDTRFVKDAELYNMFVSFNDDHTNLKVEDCKIKIPNSLFKNLNVIINIRLQKRTDNSEINFKSASLPVARYIHFGKTVDKAFPEIIAEYGYRIRVLENKVKVLENQGDLF